MKIKCTKCNRYTRASPMKGVCINCYVELREEFFDEEDDKAKISKFKLKKRYSK